MNKFIAMFLSTVLFIIFGLNQSAVVHAEEEQYVVTTDFAAFVKSGKLKNFPLSLGIKKTDVLKIWGTPNFENMDYTEYDPEPLFDKPKCSKCKFNTTVYYNYQDILEAVDVPIKPIPVQALTKQLGKPLSISSDEEGWVTYSYQFGNYEAHFSYGDGIESFSELLFTISSEAMNAKYPIKTFIDGKRMYYSDHPAVLIQGKLYVPATDMIDELGGDVYWGDNGVISFILNKKDVQLMNDSNVIKVNEKLVTLKSKPVRVKQRLLLPFDDYAKLLGIKYSWNAKTNILNITSK